MTWIFYVLLGWHVGWTWSLCNCGHGGLCFKYDDGDEKNGISAEPCMCQVVTHGIFKPMETECNVLVEHCDPNPCNIVDTLESRREICVNSLGAPQCLCRANWVGRYCEAHAPIDKFPNLSRFIGVWYWPTRQKQWDLIISAGKITPRARLIFEFDYGRSLELNISACTKTPYQKLRHVYTKRTRKGGELWRIFSRHKQWSKLIGWDDLNFSCRVPIPRVPGRSVYIKNVYGPVGHYHDVRVQIIDSTLIYHDTVHRVYLESTALERICPFNISVTGCSETLDTAETYQRSAQVILTASAVVGKGGDGVECFIKSVTYSWSLSNLRSTRPPFEVSDEKTLSFVPFDFGLKSGVIVAHLKVTFHDIIGIAEEETVTQICFFNISKEQIAMYVPNPKRSLHCLKKVDVLFESVIIRSDFLQSELSHTWVCSPLLCKDVPLNDNSLTFKTEQKCGAEHTIELKVTELMTNRTLFTQSCQIRFERKPRNIFVTCEPNSCSLVNPGLPLTVTARLDPPENGTFEWSFPPEFTYEDACHKASHIFIVKHNSFQSNTTYHYNVTAGKTTVTFLIITLSSPADLRCQVNPTTGVMFIDKFNITCDVVSDSPVLTFWVFQGELEELITISTRNHIVNLFITKTPVRISLVDLMGLVVSLVINVTLMYPAVDVSQVYGNLVLRSCHQLPLLLQAKEYDGIAFEVDRITQLMVIIDVPFAWNHTLNYLAEIRVCYRAECLSRVLNSLIRLLKSVKLNSEGVDDVILKASVILYTMTQLLSSSIPRFEFNNMVPIVNAIHEAACTLMRLVDSFLDDPFLEEDVRQMHYRKVLLGNTMARRALSTLALFITSNIMHPSEPFHLRSRNCGENITVVSHQPTYINCILRMKADKTYFRFSNDVIEQWGNTYFPISVSMVHYNTTNFWWSALDAKTGEMAEVDVFYGSNSSKDWTRMNKSALNGTRGPIKMYIRMREKTIVEVRGNASKVNSSDAGDPELLDKYVSVQRVTVPRGKGSLHLSFPEMLFGKIHVKISQLSRPNHLVVSRAPVLNRSTVDFHFHTSLPRTLIYIGILSNSSTDIEYYFNLSLLRCVTMSERMWKSESCRYGGFVGDGTIRCYCSHLSLMNVAMSSLETVLDSPINGEIPFVEKTRYWHSVIVLCIVIAMFIVIYFIGEYLNKYNESKMYALYLDDNYPRENYPYLVAVFTGGKLLSGTSSNVALQLIGDKSRSRVHMLTSSRVSMSWAQDNWYILFSERCLGTVTEIELWHDSKGFYSGWYCTEVYVWDLITGDCFQFPVYTWINLKTMYSTKKTTFVFNKKDPADKVEVLSILMSHLYALTREYHCWISVFLLHPRSLHFREERVLILLLIVLVALTSSLMFEVMYFSGEDEPIKISVVDFYVSLKSLLVILFVVFIMEYLFFRGNTIRMERYLESIGRPLKDVQQWLRWFFFAPVSPMPLIGDNALFIRDIVETQCGKVLRRFRMFFSSPVTLMPIMTEKFYHLKRKRFNCWTYTAYGFALIVVVYCIGAILFYGDIITRSVGVKWIITVVIALFCEALVWSPLKIVITGYFVATTVRTSAHEIVVIHIEPTQDVIPFKNIRLRLELAIESRVQPKYKPPLWSNVMIEATKRAKIEKLDLFYHFIVTILFLLIFLLIYTMEIKLKYHRNNILTEHFARSPSSVLLNLESVLNRTLYFDYLRATVLPSLHHISWYNGKPIRTAMGEPTNISNISRPSTQVRGYCADYSTKLIGVPQLLMRRVSPALPISIASSFTTTFSTGHGYLSDRSEDRNTYLPNWKTPEEGEVYYVFFRYVTNEEYQQSGYIQNLQWSRGGSLGRLIDLQFDNWLDGFTRSIVVTFNLYNLNVDKISYFTIMTECLPSGMYRSWVVTESASVGIEGWQSPRLNLVVAACITIVLLAHMLHTWAFISQNGIVAYASRISGFFSVAMILAGFTVVLCLIESFIHFTPYDETSAAAEDEYVPLQFKLEKSTGELVFIGVFSLITASFTATLVKKNLDLGTVSTGLSRFKWLILIIFPGLVLMSIHPSLEFYYFGTPEISGVVSIYLKEARTEIRDTLMKLYLIPCTILIQVYAAIVVHSYIVVAKNKRKKVRISWSSKVRRSRASILPSFSLRRESRASSFLQKRRASHSFQKGMYLEDDSNDVDTAQQELQNVTESVPLKFSTSHSPTPFFN